MRAIIMAGGKGTRIASLNAELPKPMLSVCGKPILQYQLECLKRQEITEIILSVGHMADKITGFFGDGKDFGVSISYITEDEPMGTAGALYYLKERVNDDFLLINGDLIFDVDIHALMNFHKHSGAIITLIGHPNDHPYDSGVIVANADSKVLKLLNKEDKRLWYKNCVNAGIHSVSPKLLENFSAPTKVDLDRDVISPLIGTGRVSLYTTPEYIKDMGTPKRIAEVEHDVKAGLPFLKNLINKQRAVFLDRDGTLNKYVGFLRNIDDLELLSGAAEAVRKINKSGRLAILITNQPVVARGELSWEQLHEIHNKLETLLGREGAYIDGIFVCPHHPDKGFDGEVVEYKIDCACRKPKPGLFFDAANKFNIDLSRSHMIGDTERDIEAGIAAGCRTIKVGNGRTLLQAIDMCLSE